MAKVKGKMKKAEISSMKEKTNKRESLKYEWLHVCLQKWRGVKTTCGFRSQEICDTKDFPSLDLGTKCALFMFLPIPCLLDFP